MVIEEKLLENKRKKNSIEESPQDRDDPMRSKLLEKDQKKANFTVVGDHNCKVTNTHDDNQ